jgi:cytochrome c
VRVSPTGALKSKSGSRWRDVTLSVAILPGVFLIPDRVFEARMTTLHFGHDCRLARLLQAFVAALLLTSLSSGIGFAQDPSAQRGRSFALANCARCHSIDKVSPSPLAIAPPFRTLHQRYPVESLEEALGEGIVTSHPTMPEFRLEPDQIGDFIRFLKTLE